MAISEWCRPCGAADAEVGAVAVVNAPVGVLVAAAGAIRGTVVAGATTGTLAVVLGAAAGMVMGAITGTTVVSGATTGVLAVAATGTVVAAGATTGVFAGAVMGTVVVAGATTGMFAGAITGTVVVADGSMVGAVTGTVVAAAAVGGCVTGMTAGGVAIAAAATAGQGRPSEELPSWVILRCTHVRRKLSLNHLETLLWGRKCCPGIIEICHYICTVCPVLPLRFFRAAVRGTSSCIPVAYSDLTDRMSLSDAHQIYETSRVMQACDMSWYSSLAAGKSQESMARAVEHAGMH
jgi:hypothetical protein